VGIVSITESSVDKSLIIYSPHFIEQVKGSFCTFHRLFSRVVKFFSGQDDCLVKIENSEIIEAAKDIEMYFVFHEFELLVEGIIPNNFKIIDNWPILFVPIESLAHDDSIAEVHLDGRDILVNNFNGGLIVR
jgi:hypothetical protein